MKRTLLLTLTRNQLDIYLSRGVVPIEEGCEPQLFQPGDYVFFYLPVDRSLVGPCEMTTTARMESKTSKFIVKIARSSDFSEITKINQFPDLKKYFRESSEFSRPFDYLETKSFLRAISSKRGHTHRKPSQSRVELGTSVPAFQERVPTISTDIEQIFNLINARAPLVFISGSAGTGKSTAIKKIVEKYGELINIAIVAPTGVAAIQAKGTTINSFFGFPAVAPFLGAIPRVNETKRKVIQELDLLIIDEVSMVRADMIDAINLYLRVNGRDEKKPFGGISVLFVGDLHQLPPVINARNRAEKIRFNGGDYETPYFFSAHSLTGEKIRFLELKRIYRQSDKVFIGVLNSVRSCNDLQDAVNLINQRVVEGSTFRPSNGVHLCCRNATAEQINMVSMEKLKSKKTVYRGILEGDFGESFLTTPIRLELKIGSQVMFTNNDPKGRWVNGSTGEVLDTENQRVRVGLLSDDRSEYWVEPATWQRFEFRFIEGRRRIEPVAIGTYTQIPLMPAWAITIHKSQGKTIAPIVVDLGVGAFAYGQVYVALSRAPTLNDIFLNAPIRIDDITVDPKILEFYASLTT